jgi:hypothetical protein
MRKKWRRTKAHATTRLYDPDQGTAHSVRGREDQVVTRRGSCCAAIGGSIAIRRRRCKKPSPKYLTWTEDHLLRQVVYEGLREDKPAHEVARV